MIIGLPNAVSIQYFINLMQQRPAAAILERSYGQQNIMG